MMINRASGEPGQPHDLGRRQWLVGFGESCENTGAGAVLRRRLVECPPEGFLRERGAELMLFDVTRAQAELRPTGIAVSAAKHQQCIDGSGQAERAGYLVTEVVCAGFPQMMDDQDRH